MERIPHVILESTERKSASVSIVFGVVRLVDHLCVRLAYMILLIHFLGVNLFNSNVDAGSKIKYE